MCIPSTGKIAIPDSTPRRAGSKSWDIAVPLISVCLEQQLHPQFLLILIPPLPIPPIGAIHLSRLELECTRLVRLGGNQQILEALVRLLDLLLEGAHEPHARCDALRDLRVLQLIQHALLQREGIADLGDLVSGPPDLDHVLAHLHASHAAGHAAQQCALALAALLGLFGRTPREIGLVLAALRVGEVRAIVLVDGQAEPAFKRAQVVFEEVRVLGQVNGFEGQLAQTLATIGVGCARGCDAAAAEFRAGTVLA
jgi:hypothetical protein